MQTKYAQSMNKAIKLLRAMPSLFKKVVHRILFGKPVPGEKANYVRTDFKADLKKWEQQ